mmetsp:Transcript_8111/g.27223  ORF Transcript_8111/g.27223 Transcript_8111/m.27223 type:complete len:89 (-) Transcript_8111:11-277(-)
MSLEELANFQPIGCARAMQRSLTIRSCSVDLRLGLQKYRDEVGVSSVCSEVEESLSIFVLLVDTRAILEEQLQVPSVSWDPSSSSSSC